MSKIEVRQNEPFEVALRRFKRKVERDGLLRELKERKHYEKPSARKRRKMKSARPR